MDERIIEAGSTNGLRPEAAAAARAGGAVDGALVAITAPASAAAEQFRVLYHRLERQQQVEETRFKLLALTSAVAGEGKSLTAANLALIAAGADPARKVLLIDADLRRPRLAGLLGVEGRPGLGEVLEGEASWPQCLRRPAGSGLHVLPAGAARADAGQLLGGPQMRALLAELRAQFDAIYLDAPPVLPVADGALLAGLSDAVVLVVRAGSTARQAVGQAVDALGGARLVGCVLNAVEVNEVPYLARGPAPRSGRW